jgi:carboxymethylenebutenolidase
MAGSMVRFDGEGRKIEGYLALPPVAKGIAPAIVVVHEIFGLTPHIEDVAERFAAAGYVTLAPDLYTGPLGQALPADAVMGAMRLLRSLPDEVQADPAVVEASLSSAAPQERRAAAALARVFDPAQRESFSRDLDGAVNFLRTHHRVDAIRIGAVGFCMGGSLVAMLSTLDPDLRAGVIFYGEGPAPAQASKVRAKLLGIYGEEDPRIMGQLPAVVDGMRAAGKKFEHHVFKGAKHAFFNDTREMHHPEAAADAWKRTLEFLKRNL